MDSSSLAHALLSSQDSSRQLASWLRLAQSSRETDLLRLLQGQPPETLEALSQALAAAGGKALEPRTNRYLEAYRKREPRFPSGPQRALLCLDHVEHVLYGGAAGGGKSSAGLAAALQYVDVPGYSAICFRATYQDLRKPEALIPRSLEWLQGTGATWRETDMQWRFPEGSTLNFGYLDDPRAHLSHQGAAYQCVVFEEAGQLRPAQMEYIASRVRRPAPHAGRSPRTTTLADVPLRFRYTANPGDRAHEWLVARFILSADPQWKFIPAMAADNPGMDVEDYTRRLAAIADPILREQLLNGNWGAVDRSGLVVPEFTEAVEAMVVAEHVRPPFFYPLVTVDTGSKDLTVFLFGYVDFIANLLVIEAELVLRDPSTKLMGDGVVAMEKELWSVAREHGAALQARRKADGDGRYLRDMAEHPYFLPFTITTKQDAEHARRKCRSDLVTGRIVISPRCTHLIRTLKHARKTQSGEWERTEELGHADAWASLVYKHRNAPWDVNPYPRMVMDKTRQGTFIEAPKTTSHNDRASELARHFGFATLPVR